MLSNRYGSNSAIHHPVSIIPDINISLLLSFISSNKPKGLNMIKTSRIAMLGMSLRLSHRIEQRLEHKLQLVLAIRPPKGTQFKEPDPVTPMHAKPGEMYVVMTEEDILSYADGCKEIGGIIESEDPDAVIVALRGAYPVARCVDPYLTKEYETISAKTSYFLDNIGERMNKALKKCKRKKSFGKVVMIDTSVTGTKLGWFIPQLMGSLEERCKDELDFVTTVLWHDKEGMNQKNMHEYGKVTHTSYDLGVRSLICEDSTTLLGVPYSRIKDLLRDGAKLDEIAAYEPPFDANIHVIEKDGTERVHKLAIRGPESTTAGLFVKLVGEYARK